MVASSWTDVIASSFQHAWNVVIGFLPELIGALVLLIVGLLVASILRVIFEKIIDALKIDTLLRKLGVERFFERAGMKVRSGKFIGALVYWFFVVVVVLAISDILGLWGLSTFLNEVLVYFPNIIVAVLILLAAIVIANFLRGLVRASVMSAKLHSSKFLGALTWWSVVLFGFFAALLQLGVAAALIQTIVTGFIAMLALAGGIAFGLGGRDYASHLIGRLREHTEER
jgi:Mechanosensitive ion channel, conserved TM helix